MTGECSAQPRRWAPARISVLTLALAIVALECGVFVSLDGMEERLRADMRAMENRIREDLRELRGDLNMSRERESHFDERVSRLETRFDEEFLPRAESVAPRAADVRNEPATAGSRLSGAG